MSFIKFSNEPKRPETDAFEVFYNRLKNSKNLNKEEKTYNSAKSMWGQLNEERKNLFIVKAKENKDLYVTELQEFVKSLNDYQKKMYLGYRRKTIYDKLGLDIFEELYPNVDYPVFKMPSKNLSPIKVEKSNNKRKLEDEDQSDNIMSPSKKIVEKSPSKPIKKKSKKDCNISKEYNNNDKVEKDLTKSFYSHH